MDTTAARGATQARLAFTGAVAVLEAAHLGWEQAHGGIVSHHLLQDPAMPALWNGWGLLVVPALAWIASRRVFPATDRPDPAALRRLLAALFAGLALSIAFANGREDIAGVLFPAIVLSGVALRAYRIEYLLGFVLGMAYTFGGLLPVLIGGVIALASAAVWLGLWPLFGRGLALVRR
ncbi:hypothetical protein [Lysobacter xanthus]